MSQYYVPRFPRYSPKTPRVAAERELFRNLELIAGENLEPEDYGRKAAKESLLAVYHYLDMRGLSGQAADALSHVIGAFEDLERGIQPEVFDVREPRDDLDPDARKWTRSLAGQEARIFCTACLGALMASGMLKDEAAVIVARHVQSWPRFSEGIIKESTVKNWRDEILQMADGALKKRQYFELLSHFVRDGKATSYLQEVLDKGPPLTFGRRKTET